MLAAEVIEVVIKVIRLHHFKLVTVTRHHVFKAKSMGPMQENEFFCKKYLGGNRYTE